MIWDKVIRFHFKGNGTPSEYHKQRLVLTCTVPIEEGLVYHCLLYPTPLLRQSIATLRTTKHLWLAVADKHIVTSTSMIQKL